MGQAVKYATLGIAIGIIIAVIVGVIGDIIGDGAINDASNTLASVIGNQQLIDTIRNVRGALNYVFGSSSVITFCLWTLFVLPVIKLGLAVSLAIVRFMNQ